MKKYFYLEQSPINNKWIIKLDDSLFKYFDKPSGSYNVLPARVLGISYANFLRLCRTECGATIIGKNEKYPITYFERSDEVMALLKTLNLRMKLVESELSKGYYYIEDDFGKPKKVTINFQ